MPQKIYDVRLDREITTEEAAELLKRAIEEGKWRLAAYYNQLLARLIIEELRAAGGGGTATSRGAG